MEKIKRTKVVDVLQRTDYGTIVNVRGWVRTHRSSKAVDFIALNDGSTIKNVQVVVDPSKFDEAMLKQITTGACINVNGELVEKEIRSLEVSNHVSPIAAVPFVREALVEQQQKMGEDKGIVMDGRDIGTTVFPNAELKIFVTASSQVRAQRRFDELKEKGMPADFDAILKNVEERDYIDTHRETSPLRKADEAITLDNSNMTIPEQKAWLMEQYQKAIAE